MKPSLRLLTLLAVSIVAALVAIPAGGAAHVDWPGFLHDPGHSSYQPGSTVITPDDAGRLVASWHWQPSPPTKTEQPSQFLFASPTVYGGSVFIGSNTGVFTALDETTGAVEWKRFLGFVPTLTCYKRGITSTAAVAMDPAIGEPVVYVGGGDGKLYALKASDGSVVWKATVVQTGKQKGKNAGYNWGSPMVADGHVYMGMSSQCDTPLIRGGVREFDAQTGARLATYFTVPAGAVGASVWSSQAYDAATDSIWVTTGNNDPDHNTPGDSNSVVRLQAGGLAKTDMWTVPPSQRIVDSDFGGSPTLFEATLSGTPTPMIGACNKNGIYYALRQSSLSSGPVWQRRLGTGRTGGSICVAAAVWDADNGTLFVGGTDATIGGTSFPGSIRQLDPATGAQIWARGLPAGPVLGSPTLDGAGVIAVSTYNENTESANRTYLIDASTGAILHQVPADGSVFSQPVFADGYLFLSSRSGGLTAFEPGP